MAWGQVQLWAGVGVGLTGEDKVVRRQPTPTPSLTPDP